MVNLYQLAVKDVSGEVFYSKPVPRYDEVQRIMDLLDQDEFGFVQVNDDIYVNRKYVVDMRVVESNLKVEEDYNESC